MDNIVAYRTLGTLIQTMPSIPGGGLGLPSDFDEWVARVHAVLIEKGFAGEAATVTTSAEQLFMPGATRLAARASILSAARRALAMLEMKVSPSSQGAFIAAGDAYDALAAVGKVLEKATAEVLIVDPYMDIKAVDDFAVLAKDAVTVRLLADAAHAKPSLKPAVDRWVQQHGAQRPLEARLAAARSLHDRLIIVDNRDAWVLTQSLNGFATRAPASIVRSDDEVAALKVTAYAAIWGGATAI